MLKLQKKDEHKVGKLKDNNKAETTEDVISDAKATEKAEHKMGEPKPDDNKTEENVETEKEIEETEDTNSDAKATEHGQLKMN